MHMQSPAAINPDARARQHLRAVRDKGRSLSERRARRAGHQALGAAAHWVDNTRGGLIDWRPDYPVYDGAELRPYEGRPGAMDAFSKPSLISGVRRAHRVPSNHTEPAQP